MSSQDSSALGGRPEARERGLTEQTVAQSKALRHCWLECIGADPASSIYLHPDVAFEPRNEDPSKRLLFTSPGAIGERLSFSAVAVLAPKRLRLPASMPVGVPLAGYWVVGHQIAGPGAYESVQLFVQEVIALLARGGAEFVLFDDVEVGTPLWKLLHATNSRRRQVECYAPYDPQPHWYIEFPEISEQYWNQFAGKTLRNIRREGRRLEHSVVYVTKKEDVVPFLAKAHQVALKTWQAKRHGLRIPNSDDQRRVLEAIASLGALRSYVIEHNGHPVAFGLGIQWNGQYSYEETGYDADFAKYSPGTILLLRMIEDMIGHNTPRSFDFGFGHAEYKRLFGNRKARSGPLMLVRRSWRPMTAVYLARFVRGASTWIRAQLNGSWLMTRLRQSYRH